MDAFRGIVIGHNQQRDRLGFQVKVLIAGDIDMEEKISIQDINIDSEVLSVEELREAAISVFSAQDADFQKLKNAKWYQRFLRSITFGAGDKKKILTDIRSLAKLQSLFMLAYQRQYCKLDDQLNHLIDDLRKTNSNIKKLYLATVIKIKPQVNLTDLNELDKSLLTLFLAQYTSINGKDEEFRKYRSNIGIAVGALMLPEGDFEPSMLEKVTSAETFYRCTLEMCALDGLLDSFEIPDNIYQALEYLDISTRKKGTIQDNLQREIQAFGTEYLLYKYSIADTMFDLSELELSNHSSGDALSSPREATYLSSSSDSNRNINEISSEELTKHFLDYKSEAEAGVVDAQFLLGKCYKEGYGTEADSMKAFQWFSKAAERGQIDSQYMLGILYQNGEVEESDHAKAFQWFRKAAEQGHANAQYELALLYRDGTGVERNNQQAVDWFLKAVEQRHLVAEAMFQLLLAQLRLNYLSGDVRSISEIIGVFATVKTAAEHGNSYGQFSLGEFLFYGVGVKTDESQAISWWHKAANAGNPNAQNALGDAYMRGRGVRENKALAVQFYQKAAEQGFTPAQHSLGECYLWGRGIEKNIDEGFKLLISAAEHHNTDAMFNLGRYYSIGCFGSKTINITEARKWLLAAIEQGDTRGHYYLAKTYEPSDTSNLRSYLQTADGKEMVKHYRLAADSGDSEAKKRLRKLSKYL